MINDKDYRKYIEDTAIEAAKQVVSQFKTKGILKDTKQTAYQKTETLLYNYNSFKLAIKEKNEYIKYLQKYGIESKSKSITSISTSNSYTNSKDLDEITEEKIINIKKSIAITQNLINLIDSALSKLEKDKYYEVIQYKYFEKKTNDEIAEIYDVDSTTISRNKSRMINILKIYLFSDDVVEEIFA
ncbi:hypothetical protein [Sedimentibacter sp.]|uniref:hypothetical protein n=1 Tax=Sedimentibacter sp. TaxID=1960295 RepID=UPI0028AAF484|nr:hypothetical protein [Sedimentibacter sp.]